jgi:hypothetical protein
VTADQDRRGSASAPISAALAVVAAPLSAIVYFGVFFSLALSSDVPTLVSIIGVAVAGVIAATGLVLAVRAVRATRAGALSSAVRRLTVALGAIGVVVCLSALGYWIFLLVAAVGSLVATA